MERRARAAFLTAALVLFALPAQAEGGEHSGLRDLLFWALNFALVIGVLVYFAREPVSDFFGARRRRIQEELKAAADLRTEAEARYAKWQRRLMDLESELAGIRERRASEPRRSGSRSSPTPRRSRAVPPRRAGQPSIRSCGAPAPSYAGKRPISRSSSRRRR